MSSTPNKYGKKEIECHALKTSGICPRGTKCQFQHRANQGNKQFYNDYFMSALEAIHTNILNTNAALEKYTRATTLQCVALTNLSKQVMQLEADIKNLKIQDQAGREESIKKAESP